MNNQQQNIPTALLIAGNSLLAQQEAYTLIKHIYCTHLLEKKPCNNCSECHAINAGTHYSLIIIKPEKRYVLDDLALIFKKSSFKLDSNEHCFFIIHKADLLSSSCANTLLKLVEEPPQGYHFIFLTERPLAVIPTIRSRCTIKTIRELVTTEHATFLYNFTALMPNVLTFQKELAENAPSEEVTALIIDQLLQIFIERYKEAIKENNEKIVLSNEKKIIFLKKSLLNLPMPGSSKIFWKNFYLQFYAL